MQLITGLDYELFFGHRTGSVEKCLIRPSEAIARVAKRQGIKLVFFVDAGMLVKFRQLAPSMPEMDRQYRLIRENLRSLVSQGHELQLHVHPHWEHSTYSDGEWQFDYSTYRLHSFSQAECLDIVQRYTQELADIAGYAPSAYRAGGWCLQPFDQIRPALEAVGVFIDSSVIEGSRATDSARFHDFTSAPKEAVWRFSTDPVERNDEGRWLEVPITPVRANALFYWRYLVARKLAGSHHQGMGDGASYSAGLSNYLKKLFSIRETLEASIDGYKVTLLPQAMKTAKRRGNILNIMGHPKALSPFSLEYFDRFVQANHFDTIGFEDINEQYSNFQSQ